MIGLLGPATPVTTPVPEPTVAWPTLLLLHEPVPVGSDNTVVDPTHTTPVPAIATGLPLTVTMRVAAQPVGNVYDMVDVPAVMPVTVPLVTEAPAVLLHVPPPVASASTVVRPTHTEAVPVMAAGLGLIVIGNTAKQPVLLTV
jgi:hypothetical protein